LFPENGESAEELMRHADERMYEVKRANRGARKTARPVPLAPTQPLKT